MAIFGTGSKSTSRQRAIQEDVQEAKSQTRVGRHYVLHVAAIWTVFFIFATVLMMFPAQPSPFAIGQRSPADVFSPVAFTVMDDAKTQARRSDARETTPPVLIADPAVLDRIQSQLADLYQDVKGINEVEALPQDTRTRWPTLSSAALQWLHEIDPATYQLKVHLLAETLNRVPLVDAATAAMVQSRRSPTAFVGHTAEDAVEINKLDVILLRPSDMNSYMKLYTIARTAFPQKIMGDVLASYLIRISDPTFHFDKSATEKRMNERVAAINVPEVEVQENQRLISKNEFISENEYNLIREADWRFRRTRALAQPGAYWFSLLGQVLTVAIIATAMAFYAARINPEVKRFSRAWALAGLLIAALFLAKSCVYLSSVQYLYLFGMFPTLLTAIILIIAFNQRFALGIASLHGLLVTLALGQGIDFFLPMLAGIAIFVLGLKEIRKRARLVEMGVLAGAAVMGTVWAMGMTHFMGNFWDPRFIAREDPESLLFNSLYAAAAAVATGFIVSGILPFIEKVFRITTAMTLLELADAHHPLLRRMAAEAAGTFNHSLIVGTLAENAASAINANGLLCRVGAYYHDVGKLSKPQYFIENQAGGPNRHEKLSPAMSLLIIVGHVKDGIELARQYGLPVGVRQFIAEHHGTTLVEYFFHAAKRRAEQGQDQSPVQETEFRYPGPRPQTKEAAILMICDGTESIVRSLPEQTHGRIESVTHQLIMKRLMDGQFSDCDLTLKELAQIEQALVKTLTGVYHTRVAYPKPLALTQSQPA